MRNYTIRNTDGVIAWDKELHKVANLAPAKVLDLIEHLSTTHTMPTLLHECGKSY